MSETDDLEDVLAGWGRSARDAAGEPYRFAGGPTTKRPGARSVLAVLASAGCAGAIVIGVNALSGHHTATVPAIQRRTVVGAAPAKPCAAHFGLLSSTLASNEQTVWVALKYQGQGPCAIRTSAPGVTLESGSAFRMANPPVSGPPSNRRVVVERGAIVRFRITHFHRCLPTPAGNYKIVVDLSSSTAPRVSDSNGISVPIGHLEPDPLLCLTNGIGAISTITVSY